MANVLKLYYDRITNVSEVILDTSNCSSYGFAYKVIVDELYGTGKNVTVFYRQDGSSDDYLDYECHIVNNEPTFKTIHIVETKQRYEHIAPPCSSFAINYADVDKEGSGRNPATGLMERERIGFYRSIDVTYDLIPNSKTYNNWYKVLTHLPPDFYIEVLTPSGEKEEIRCYRADVSTSLYLFTDDYQIWRGLKTSFIQYNVAEYDDSFEPTLEEDD